MAACVLLLVGSAPAATSGDRGPLISIKPSEFVRLTEDLQAAYVAGVIDGMTFTTYGYQVPDHSKLTECIRSATIGVWTKRVASWIQKRPEFGDGTATAVAKTLGASCEH